MKDAIRTAAAIFAVIFGAAFVTAANFNVILILAAAGCAAIAINL